MKKLSVITAVIIATLLSWFKPNTSLGQNSQNEQLVKNVVLAYQDDYNDGGFKNVETYTTKDWEHINPIGGLTRGRDSVMNELRPLCQTILKGVSFDKERIILGYNRVFPKTESEIVMRVRGDVFLAVAEFGKGRSVAYTTDPVYHWCGNLHEWANYGLLWERMAKWAAREI